MDSTFFCVCLLHTYISLSWPVYQNCRLMNREKTEQLELYKIGFKLVFCGLQCKGYL